jgi:alkanesulfonate monooxygenase SsuD/methylene tetrahydromethanopterin reductase-like flavin-dependent oxidoreductase (luciferase family)
MRYGVVILPEHGFARTQQVWRHAEELGFDSAWTYDHCIWRWLAGRPWYSSVGTLTAAALATSRIRLGTMVANPALRHPVTWAKEVMTLDELSGGRVVFGVGSGGYDADLLGGRGRAGNRFTRFREFVELSDGLLRQLPTAYAGEHYGCDALVLHPACTQTPRVPLAVAAAGPAGMRLAARHGDAWVTSGAPNSFAARPWPEVLPLLRAQVRTLEEACEQQGRDPAGIERVLLAGASVAGVTGSVAAFEDASAAFADAGFTDLVVHWPRPEEPFAGSLDMLEEVAAAFRAARKRSPGEGVLSGAL